MERGASGYVVGQGLSDLRGLGVLGIRDLVVYWFRGQGFRA